jgi:hypothetical protein
MASGRFWAAVLAGGIVANIIDFLVMGVILAPVLAGIESMNQDTNPMWYVIGDFVAVFVFVLVYDRVYASFTPGMKGGAIYGFYAALLAAFPTYIFIHLMFKGYSYGLAWGMTFYALIWGMIIGAVVGSLYKK